MKKLLQLLLLLFATVAIHAQNTITGNIVDGESGEALIGANVIIDGSAEGTITDYNGDFSFSTTRDFPVTVNVSFIGYETKNITVNSSDAIGILMNTGSLLADEVIISASRRAEKIQEAPAAVSVISANEVSASGGAITPIRALINTPGVELQQQTGQRINLALRGSSGIFSTDVYPMLDYRSLITPGLELFDSQNSPINNIDIERIEVVLGPGSALYGPDVTSGVVHWISKDPFRHPGTTVELIYGENQTFKTALRHAGHTENGKVGYKINARYGSGQDFVLDPDDPDDQIVLNNFQNDVSRGVVKQGQITDADGNSVTGGYIDPQEAGQFLFSPGKFQNPDYWSAAVNGHIHLRPTDDMQIVGSGGWNSGSAVFYNDLGEGYTSSNEVYGQARLNYKGLFAQTYFIKNDGGNDENPVYLNRTGLIVPLARTHFETQVQYNFDMPFLNSEWSTGFDYRNATADSENHVYGRNEDNDDYRIAGVYLQGKLKFGDKLDLFVAGRYDGYNFTDEKTFSPRAALVYKPSPKHSFRLSYNKAANPIPASDIYFDLPVQTTPVFNVWNMGGIRTQTFADDPTIAWLVPGVPNTTYGTGFPLDAAYGFVNEDVIAGIEALGSQDPSLAPLVPALVNLLRSQTPGGFTTDLVSTDLNGNELLPTNIPTVLISFLSAYEFGYKGLFNDKLALGADVYYFRKTRGGGFSQVSPIITLTDLPNDLGASVQAAYQPQIEGLLLQSGFPAETAAAVAGQIGGLLNGAYVTGGQGFIDFLASQGLPFQGIAPTQQVPQTGLPNLAFGYPTRNADDISDDWGFEIHSKYYFSDVLTSFANYTWFNRPTGLAGDLNFPQNKVRLGMSYGPQIGFKGGFSYQWNQAYTSNNSTFPGTIEARSLVDASIGYGMDNGLKLEASATNLLNKEFRTLPGFPKIGRQLIGRVVYDF